MPLAPRSRGSWPSPDPSWTSAPTWLSATSEPTSDDLSAARQRRLTSVSPDEPSDGLSSDELPLGADAIEMVAGEDEPSPAETTLDFGDTSLGTERSMESYLDGESTEPAEPGTPDAADDTAADAATDEPPATRPKKRGRASVPVALMPSVPVAMMPSAPVVFVSQ